MYISWNDFDQPNANIFVTFSSDGGATWHSPVMVSTQSTFIRNVQMTGDLATGDVYIAGMDEGGGGFPHQDTNLIFKSTDGGNTWMNTYTGPQFPGPALLLSVISPACFSMAVAIGGTRVGVSLPPSTV